MKYPIVIERAGSNFCAWSPDVPGCVATGDSQEELRKSFPETLRRHFRALLDVGGRLPQPSALAEMVDVEDVA